MWFSPGSARGALAAGSHTISGRLIGVPRGASTTIEAVAVRRDAVVAARTLRGSTSTVRVPAGPIAVAEQGTVSWDIEWSPSIAGNGEWDQIAAASMASGDGSVDVVAGHQPQSCTTGFRLSPTYPPALAEHSTRSEITIGVPKPVLDSVGTGTGPPSIEPTNSECPPVFAALPPEFSVTFPLRHDTVTREVSGGDSYTPSDPSGKGSSTMKGTITVQVG